MVGLLPQHAMVEVGMVEELSVNRVFAVYPIFCWVGKYTGNYYYEADELLDPRPTQPKENQVKSGMWATFSHNKYFFVGWD